MLLRDYVHELDTVRKIGGYGVKHWKRGMRMGSGRREGDITRRGSGYGERKMCKWNDRRKEERKEKGKYTHRVSRIS